jgi:hypothetical protein
MKNFGEEFWGTNNIQNFCQVYDRDKTGETEIWRKNSSLTSQKKMRGYSGKLQIAISSFFHPIFWSVLKRMREKKLEIRKTPDLRSV